MREQPKGLGKAQPVRGSVRRRVVVRGDGRVVENGGEDGIYTSSLARSTVGQGGKGISAWS